MAIFYKDVTRVEGVVSGFECSKCLKRFTNADVVEMQEALHWRNLGGYGSVWGDGNTVEVSLCQNCTLELFEGFATVHD